MLNMKPSHLQNFPAYVVSDLEKRRKTSQGTTVSTRQDVVVAAAVTAASEDGMILSAGTSLGDEHHHHQKRKRPWSLKDNLLHLIRQIDLHTSQVVINYYYYFS